MRCRFDNAFKLNAVVFTALLPQPQALRRRSVWQAANFEFTSRTGLHGCARPARTTFYIQE